MKEKNLSHVHEIFLYICYDKKRCARERLTYFSTFFGISSKRNLTNNRIYSHRNLGFIFAKFTKFTLSQKSNESLRFNPSLESLYEEFIHWCRVYTVSSMMVSWFCVQASWVARSSPRARNSPPTSPTTRGTDMCHDAPPENNYKNISHFSHHRGR